MGGPGKPGPFSMTTPNRRERRLLDFDPITGTSCVVEFDVDGSMHIDHYQDYGAVEAVAEHNLRLRNEEQYRKKNKDDIHHYATIPNIWIMKWKQELGVDLYNKGDMPKVMKLLNTEYQWMKTTNKHHDR
jgi:hypothetical protein